MRTWLEKDAPPIWEWEGPTGVKFRDIRQPSGCYYHDTTPPEVVTLLERAKGNYSKVRLFYGDRETGKNWMGEYDVYGRISSSMGPHKIPILIKSERSMGGGGILADCIVCLMVGGRVAYKHPDFKFPEIRVGLEGAHEDTPWAAYVDGDKNPHARFKTERSAKRWSQFMRGERMAK